MGHNHFLANHDQCCLLQQKLMYFGILYCKQYEHRSDCSLRNSMFGHEIHFPYASFKDTRIGKTDDCSPNKCLFENGSKLISQIVDKV